MASNRDWNYKLLLEIKIAGMTHYLQVPLQCPYSALTVPLQCPYGFYNSALIFYILKGDSSEALLLRLKI